MRDSEYDEIARRFFNQFLELKIQLDLGNLSKPKNYDKELAQYKKANDQLKGAAADLAKTNAALEEDLEKALANNSDLRRLVNELTIDLGLANEKLQGLGVVRQEVRRTGYSFTDHMSDESKRAWDQLMREIPYRGTKDTE